MSVKKKILYSLAAVGGLVLVSLVIQIRAHNMAEQARFNVDVLDQFIQSYRAIKGAQIESLDQVPDFEIISAYKSLSARGADIRDRIFGGYIYDMKYSEGGKYVISAQPVGFLTPNIAYGVTEQGLLGVGRDDAGSQPPTRESVNTWPWITREVGLRTKSLPAYLKD